MGAIGEGHHEILIVQYAIATHPAGRVLFINQAVAVIVNTVITHLSSKDGIDVAKHCRITPLIWTIYCCAVLIPPSLISQDTEEACPILGSPEVTMPHRMIKVGSGRGNREGGHIWSHSHRGVIPSGVVKLYRKPSISLRESRLTQRDQGATINVDECLEVLGTQHKSVVLRLIDTSHSDAPIVSKGAGNVHHLVAGEVNSSNLSCCGDDGDGFINVSIEKPLEERLVGGVPIESYGKDATLVEGIASGHGARLDRGKNYGIVEHVGVEATTCSRRTAAMARVIRIISSQENKATSDPGEARDIDGLKSGTWGRGQRGPRGPRGGGRGPGRGQQLGGQGGGGRGPGRGPGWGRGRDLRTRRRIGGRRPWGRR